MPNWTKPKGPLGLFPSWPNNKPSLLLFCKPKQSPTGLPLLHATSYTSMATCSTNRPRHFYKSRGSIARHILQQLQNVDIVDLDTKGGRKITSKRPMGSGSSCWKDCRNLVDAFLWPYNACACNLTTFSHAHNRPTKRVTTVEKLRDEDLPIHFGVSKRGTS